ncbi:MAG: glutamate--tRNA ligase [Candidatus Diapherotrites archaeon]|nr:glutamate--tRNA ligase [Candidatus Diapherotrites archaeon]
MDVEKVRELAYKYALKNAVEHGGRASVGAVIGKILAEDPSLKPHAREIANIVKEVVKKVNQMDPEEQKKEMERFTYNLPRRERRGLPPLPNAERGRVVLRFAPEPGGYIHLGNLRAAIVNHLYAEEYDGTFILRYDDTNPYKAKLPYYDAIREDLEAVGVKIHRIVYQSDRLEIYVNYLRELISKGLAYASFDPPEEVNRKRKEKLPLEGRDRSPEENLEILDAALEGKYDEGELAFFLKVDPAHPNPVLRDPGIARVITRVPHPRRGWRFTVYPLYNFASAVDDGTLGITHILRGKDHENNGKVQRIIQEYLGLNKPEVIAFGRLKIEEGEFAVGLSKRKIREALRKGLIDHWGDPRTLTVRALLNRGILPETLVEFFRNIGPKKTDITLKMENIYALNRQKIDPVARRVFFVEDPVLLEVEGAPEVKARLPWHPDRDMGQREYRFRSGTHRLWVERSDLREKRLRLKYLYNIEVLEVGEDKARARYAGDEVGKESKIHWVPHQREGEIHGKVLFPSGEERNGVLEPWAQTLKDGEIVQLDRHYFARVWKNNGEVISLYYTHR